MKRNLLYKWALAAIMSIATFTSAFAVEKITSLDQLKAGSVIKIYPYGKAGESSYALACAGNGSALTSYSSALAGDEWVLVDAGSGYYYLNNDRGCYWAYQNSDIHYSLTCTTDISSAVKVKLTWDSKNGGVCFWNEQDGKGLNNLYGWNSQYNWYSSSSDYDTDTNTTFDVLYYTFDDFGNKEKFYTENGIRYKLDLVKRTATVVNYNYSGDIVIPQTVSYLEVLFPVTAIGDKCFQDCSALTSVTLPNSITSLSDNCFYLCI